MKPTAFKIAVLGATGQLGREILQALAAYNIPVANVVALATAHSLGAAATYGDEDEVAVADAARFDYSTVDLVVSALPESAARSLLPPIAKQGVRVIDCSPAFRMDPDTPLLVAGVNDDMLNSVSRHMVAVPDAMACMLAQALKPLHVLSGIQRVVVASYQAASTAGRPGMDELFNQTRAVYVNDPMVKEQFPKQIAFNVIPQVGNFREDGQTDAEFALMTETKKVLDTRIKVAATCVRIPSFLGSALAVTAECEREVDLTTLRAAMRRLPNLSVVDHRTEEGYVTPAEAAGEDSVYVSRLRDDMTAENGISFWVVGDTLRAGVAVNAVRLALAWAAAGGQAMPRAATVH